MATFVGSLVAQSATVLGPITFPVLTDSYCTLEEGETFIASEVLSDPWTLATDVQRLTALRAASRMVDRLPFARDKADSSQFLEFPRGDDTEVPAAVKQATFYCALRLLDGYDPEIEGESSHITSQTYSGVRSGFDPGRIPEHVYMGIPSIRAYHLLCPYLRDLRALNLYRTN